VLAVEIIDTNELGDRTYVAHDGHTAVVIDPQRDIDRVEDLLEAGGLTCAAVLETHIHNDYVSGGLELARRNDADYLVNDADPVSFTRRGIKDGDVVSVGDLEVTAIATPGHTATHLAYLVEVGGSDGALFSGGSLLFGSVGRTDLMGDGRTVELTRAQLFSARRLGTLPGGTSLFPTHGFGSFCSTGAMVGGDSSTIGEQLHVNDALLARDDDAYVDALIAHLSDYPSYYAHMGARNLAGAGAADLSPPSRADAADLAARIAAGEWVVDLRHRRAFSHGHLNGSIGIELGTQFATYLGWLIPWGTPLTLVGDDVDDIRSAQRQLVRIGIERPDAAALGPVEQLTDGRGLGSYEVATFDDLARSPRSSAASVLDVRDDVERARSSIPGSLHLPLHKLDSAMHQAQGDPIWVHCASGYRASVAAGLLARAGHDVVLVDDSFDRAVQLGLVLEQD
jgi:glyoxylase-like metal-dependent hydrolase (beta-lactamase superfamily II)/rhodanese-related sulfurtransferase